MLHKTNKPDQIHEVNQTQISDQTYQIDKISQKISRSLGTHDGTFHADEVTACALLIIFDLIDRDKIHRTRDRDLLNKCEYVCDVGGIYDPSEKLFDHHQADYTGNLSSAGMILRHLRDIGKINEKEYMFFNDTIIIGVDAHDNGKVFHEPGVCTYSHIIANYTPIVYNSPPAEQDKAFLVALDFASDHLKRLWERYQYVLSCRNIVKQAMDQQEEFLFFEEGIPWQELFFEMGGVSHPAKFVIIRSGEHWNLRGIPPNAEDKMSVRIPLPKEWAGLLENEFGAKCQIPGAIFCHKGRFISVWQTKESAMEAFHYTLERAKKGLL